MNKLTFATISDTLNLCQTFTFDKESRLEMRSFVSLNHSLMFRFAFFIAFFVIGSFAQLQAQDAKQEVGIQFYPVKWSEALAKSKELKRLIFVDAYAEWCGPCKRMAATTFKAKLSAISSTKTLSISRLIWKSLKMKNLRVAFR